MRVVVTGGAGAIGSHLVARLLGSGHDVTVLDDLSSGSADLVPVSARLVVGSILDPRSLDEAFGGGVDLVAHLAALFANQNSVDHPDKDLLVNGVGTLAVLQRSVDVAARKVLVVSSSCVYVSRPELREDDPERAIDTPYAITKGLSEQYARWFARHHALDTVVVRPFNAYGPHEMPGPYRNVIPNFIAAAIRGEPLRITGTGDETRDFTYVEDVAAGMEAALVRATLPGDVFNLATGHQTRIGDLATMVNRVVGNNAGVVHVSRRSWDTTTERRASVERARQVLGHEATVALEDGLLRTYSWLRERL